MAIKNRRTGATRHEDILPQHNDELLVSQLRGGDQDAFAQLVMRWHARLLIYCRSILRNEFLAEDAVQEVLWRVHKNIDGLDDWRRLKPWMFSIAANYCRDLLRYQKSRPSVPLEGENDESPVEHPPDPISMQDAIEARDSLRVLLERLPSAYKEVLLLKEGVGLSYEEIAAATGSTLEAVRSKLARARAFLLTNLRDESAF